MIKTIYLPNYAGMPLLDSNGEKSFTVPVEFSDVYKRQFEYSIILTDESVGALKTDRLHHYFPNLDPNVKETLKTIQFESKPLEKRLVSNIVKPEHVFGYEEFSDI